MSELDDDFENYRVPPDHFALQERAAFDRRQKIVAILRETKVDVADLGQAMADARNARSPEGLTCFKGEAFLEFSYWVHSRYTGTVYAAKFSFTGFHLHSGALLTIDDARKFRRKVLKRCEQLMHQFDL